jgi:ribosomal 50S subunit-recycling heat shock protein
MTEVSVGDAVSVRMGRHAITAKVLAVREYATKEEAAAMYEIISDETEERGGIGYA